MWGGWLEGLCAARRKGHGLFLCLADSAHQPRSEWPGAGMCSCHCSGSANILELNIGPKESVIQTELMRRCVLSFCAE